MRTKEFFGNRNSMEDACNEINANIKATTPAYKPVAVLSQHDILRIYLDRIPNSTRALDVLENIIAKYSLQSNPS